MAGRKWTTEEDAFLIENYENTLMADLLLQLDRTEKAVYNRAKILGLKKSQELLKELARQAVLNNPEPYRKGQFKKGLKPWNKGMKGLMLTNGATCFKKGDKPHNTLYDGAITLRTDTKTGRQYQYIRVSCGEWVELHRYVWEQAHGAIAKGSIIAFKDGDTMNCTLENLEQITREENMSRNTLHNYPKPIADVIRLTGVINRLTKNRLKNA